MKNYILASVVILVIIAISGCIDMSNSGDTNNSGFATTNETGKLSNFNQIIVDGINYDLRITQGNKESLLVETEQNETSKIKVRVNNNKLYLNSTTTAIYHLTVKDINFIEMTGSGPLRNIGGNNLKLNKLTIKMDNGQLNYIDNLTINELTVNLNGGKSYVSAISNLNTKNLNINLNNSGKLFVDGNASNQKVNIYGSGNYTATNLTSKTANIYVNGPGYVVVRVSDILNAIIKGTGTIHYIGSPQITRKIDNYGTIAVFPLNGSYYINS